MGEILFREEYLEEKGTAVYKHAKVGCKLPWHGYPFYPSLERGKNLRRKVHQEIIPPGENSIGRNPVRRRFHQDLGSGVFQGTALKFPALMPPSTGMTAPVMYRARSEARNKAV